VFRGCVEAAVSLLNVLINIEFLERCTTLLSIESPCEAREDYIKLVGYFYYRTCVTQSSD